MKKVIFLLLILIANITKAQNDSLSKLYDSFADENQRFMSMRALADHGLLTQITGFEINFVDTRIQEYLSKYTILGLVGEPSVNMIGSNKYIIQKYEQKIQYNNNKTSTFNVKYNLIIDKQNRIIIKSCKIYGSSLHVLDFYVNFWPTSLNFEAAKKNEVVVNFLLQDRVALKWIPSTDYAEIIVTSTNK
jgi:hypothetical protein